MAYQTKEINVKGNKFSVLIVTGNNPYISIRKETNNPFKGPGRQFNNFDEAQQAYKCPEMKTQLLLVETNLI